MSTQVLDDVANAWPFRSRRGRRAPPFVAEGVSKLEEGRVHVRSCHLDNRYGCTRLRHAGDPVAERRSSFSSKSPNLESGVTEWCPAAVAEYDQATTAARHVVEGLINALRDDICSHGTPKAVALMATALSYEDAATKDTTLAMALLMLLEHRDREL